MAAGYPSELEQGDHRDCWFLAGVRTRATALIPETEPERLWQRLLKNQRGAGVTHAPAAGDGRGGLPAAVPAAVNQVTGRPGDALTPVDRMP
ncbi:hypothetical protein ACWGBH_05790 [Streptomyces massasporeus]